MTFRFKVSSENMNRSRAKTSQVSSENTNRSRAKTSQVSSENGYMYGFGDVVSGLFMGVRALYYKYIRIRFVLIIQTVRLVC